MRQGRYAESWDECGGGNGGDELYNYMVGLPMNHPQFTGKLTMISHVREPKIVQIDVPPNHRGSPGPSPGGGDDNSDSTIILIGLGAQTVVSMWSLLPLLISAILLNN